MSTQNCAFTANVEEDEKFTHPPGAALIKMVSVGLKAGTWSVSDPEVWQAGGWRIGCEREGRAIWIVVARHPMGEYWLLLMSAKIRAGMIARMLGKRPSAGDEDLLLLAQEGDRLLRKERRIAGVNWRRNWLPEPSSMTRPPE